MQNHLNIDLDLFRQPKVQKLESELGSKAVVFYLKLKLLLAQAKDYKLVKKYWLIAQNLELELKFVQSVIEDYDLFVIGDHYFWSKNVVKKMTETNKNII